MYAYRGEPRINKGVIYDKTDSTIYGDCKYLSFLGLFFVLVEWLVAEDSEMTVAYRAYNPKWFTMYAYRQEGIFKGIVESQITSLVYGNCEYKHEQQ